MTAADTRRSAAEESPARGFGASLGGRVQAAPRPIDLLADAVLTAWAQRVATITTVIVLAVVCFVALVTAGQSAASERRIVDQIDSVGTRLITISDDGGSAGIRAEGIAGLAAMSDVSWVIGLGPASDVGNVVMAGDAAGVTARALIGELPPDLVLVAGRRPAPGDAVVGERAARALGLRDGAGTLAPTELLRAATPTAHDARLVPVVGVVEASGPLANLGDAVLVATTPDEDTQVRFVHVMARDVTVVERLASALATSVPADNPAAVTVDTPAGALALRDVVAGELGASARRLLAVVLGVGAVIVAVTMLGAVAARRRDIGRRRALGATRSAIVVGVLAQTTAAAVVGILLGSASGLLALHRSTGATPAPAFVLGVAGLTVVTALVGAIGPAIAAALRDPMRILRVP